MKNLFAYIPDNRIIPLIENINLPQGIRPVEINDLCYFPYQTVENCIILLSLTGREVLREKETKLIQAVLNAPKTTVFLLLTPFNFETETNLNRVYEQLKMLYEHQVNFEELVLNEKPYLTYEQAFQEIRQVIELIAQAIFKTFNG